MIAPVREWLPDSALFPSSLALEIDTAIHDWCTAWVGAPCLSRESFGKTEKGAFPAARQIQLDLAQAGLDILIADVLGIEPSSPSLSSVEQQIIADFRAALVADFDARISVLFGLGDGHKNEGSGTSFRIGLRHQSGVRFGDIHLCHDLLVTSRKRRAPAPRRPGIPLQSLSETVGHLQLELVALPGRAILPVADVRKLAVGDVLVLDQAVAQPISLCVDRHASPVLGGVIVESEGHRRLRVENRMLQ